MVTPLDPEAEDFSRIEDVFTQDMIPITTDQQIRQGELQTQFVEQMRLLPERQNTEKDIIPLSIQLKISDDGRISQVKQEDFVQPTPTNVASVPYSNVTPLQFNSNTPLGNGPLIPSSQLAVSTREEEEEESDTDDSDVCYLCIVYMGGSL